jgi:DNA-binding transcriptional LysR family regulator
MGRATGLAVLELKRLRVFLAVAEEGSFSGAAAVLSYTQPAISHHVSQLELEVGAKLVSRRRGEPQLTAVGELVRTYARTILAGVSDAELAIAEVVGGEVGAVRIGAFATANATFVADAISMMRELQPTARLTLLEGEAADTIARLRARSIDVGVIFDSDSHAIAVPEDIELKYVGLDPMLVAVPADHPVARRVRVRLPDLAEEDWIEGAGADTPCSLILADASARCGFEPRVAFNSGDYHVVQRLVAARVGVALVPKLALQVRQGGLVIRTVECVPPRRIAIAIRAQGYRSSGIDQLLQLIISASEDYLDPLSP